MKDKKKRLSKLCVTSVVFFALVVLLILPSRQFVYGEHNTSTNERREKDSAGREWILKDWERGTRPYPKDLKEREAWYRKKWGEDWFGPRNRCSIHNPGDWKWEVVVTVQPEMAARIKGKAENKRNLWGERFNIKTFVWAPGGGEVTDIYVLSDTSFYHYDPISRKSVLIGNPEEGGLRDGTMGRARLNHTNVVTLDHVTGRIYFIQGRKKDKTWRYVEKLLPYECTTTNKICYLPAVLDWNNLYRKVKSPFGGELKPIIKDGKRGKPVFVVKSNHALKVQSLPGPHRGRRVLLTPDGRGVYFSRKWAPPSSTNYDNAALFEIATGKMIERLKLNGVVPQNYGKDGPGTHGGNNVGYDGKIYTSQHGGCCGPCGSGSGRMFSIDPKKGKIMLLYDSMLEDGSWSKRKGPIVDGPADAKSLKFTSTLWQIQSPRTGAIINGGWDHSGVRRYHDGFVTSIVSADRYPRPGWNRKTSPKFRHRNSNPSIAPNGDLYIADVNDKWAGKIFFTQPRIIRIYRTDWPPEQPVNGYAEEFMPKDKMEDLMLEYAKKYITNYQKNNRLLENR